MPLQAMAMGIPTIITPTSGQAQYAHLASVVIPVTPQESTIHEIVDFEGCLDEPDLDALVEVLRRVCGASDGYRAEALRRVGQVAEYSWVNSCRKLLNELPVGHLLDQPAFEKVLCYFKIRVNRKCEVGINNDHWDFVPGVDYTVSNNVYDNLDNANRIESFEVIKRTN
jgi:hypothetical protein